MDSPIQRDFEEFKARLEQMKSEDPEQYLRFLTEMKAEFVAFQALLEEAEREY